MKKQRKWWFRLPGQFPASDFTFDEPKTQKEVRAYLRQWMSPSGQPEVKRLPNGTESSWLLLRSALPRVLGVHLLAEMEFAQGEAVELGQVA